MQVIEKPLPSGEIVYYVEHRTEIDQEYMGDPTPIFIMIECKTKAQAIALAKLLSVTNDIYLETPQDRNYEVDDDEQPSVD